MKQKHFKIPDTTLFVYKPQNSLKNVTETEGTDPTTSMITMTKTGVFNAGRSN
ncbi:MAG: hypothetical protein JWR09_730 [Mucilaginibacter sp.]|jgi:hypothetical protein|nr:hypothetical protein [Mucilaginibacter sp.]